MGGTSYSDDDYAQRATLRAKSGTPTFAYSAKTAAAPIADRKTHDTLNPVVFGAAGKLTRESRDSVDHPNSLAIAVPFDVTGSMGEVPKTVQGKLNTLMGLLLKKGYVEDPQIMAAAVGDSYCDRAPLQVGQFESGVEIDDCLNNLYLEGGGGGQKNESYGLFLYYMANHTSIDCFEKRGKKGYIFLILDEMSHPVTKTHIKEFIGTTVERDYTFKEVLESAQKMYNVFAILPRMTSYFDDPQVNKFWRDHLGERFIKHDDPATVCELIAATIGLCENNVDLDQVDTDLSDIGTTSSGRAAVTRSLATIGKGSTGLSKDKLKGTGLSAV